MENLSGAFDGERWAAELAKIVSGQDAMINMQSERAFQKSLLQSGKLDSEYADYIMRNSCGARMICNGDMLISAMEDGYLEEQFLDFRVGF